MKLLEYSLGHDVRAFSTYREGGVSQGSYASFNVNSFCGDRPEHTEANRRILADTLHLGTDRFVIPHQTHGTEVRIIDDAFLRLGTDERAAQLEGIDALVTTTRNVCLCVSTADCVPVTIYAPCGAIACIHAGWRGMCRHIISRTIEKLQRLADDGADTRQWTVAIGPCIGRDSFEVGDEVFDAFAWEGFPMNAIAHKPNGPQGRWYLDLVEAAIHECQTYHIDRPQIEACRIDTFTHADEFFSARKSGTASGRILTGIMLL